MVCFVILLKRMVELQLIARVCSLRGHEKWVFVASFETHHKSRWMEGCEVDRSVIKQILQDVNYRSQAVGVSAH